MATSSSTPESPAVCPDLNPTYFAADARPGEATEAEMLRARIRRLEDETVALQRLAVLGTSTAMVAHEFNNLMTPILARAQLALAPDVGPLIRKALQSAITNSQKAIGITAHLLELTRNDVEQTTICNVAEAVQSALEMAVRPLERDGVTLQLDIPTDLHAAARPLLFEQVLLNLILNARTAMRERSGTLAISARDDAGAVRIELRDSGKGMPIEHVQNVLNPFLAADPLHDVRDWRAVGLGLNVCRTITRRHGATLRCRLNDGPGCTFELCWPGG